MGLGVPELLIILAVVLIIFGPGKLPALGSGIGNALRNFRKAVNTPDAIDVTPDGEKKPGAENESEPIAR
jgi:sec-independent protein translocase protein TatA